MMMPRAVNLSVTIDGTVISVYVNGQLKETKTVKYTLPESTENFAIGGDWRPNNSQYFKGTIYSVNLFSDVRTAEEIKADMLSVSNNAQDLAYSSYMTDEGAISGFNGQKFSKNIAGLGECNLKAAPKTFEAIINLPKSMNSRNVILGNNFTELDSGITSFEIYTGGRPRLYSKVGGVETDCVFSTDVRSNAPVHIAVTVENTTAELYVNGELVETKTLDKAIKTATESLMIGGDKAFGNTGYFKGIIYGINLFSDVRTAEEIKADMFSIVGADDLILSEYFLKETAEEITLRDTHKNSVRVIDKKADKENNGLIHTECEMCGKILSIQETTLEFNTALRYDYKRDDNYLQKDRYAIPNGSISKTPQTYEFLVQLPKSILNRAGILLGNYTDTKANLLNIEIYTNGKPRVYYKVKGTVYNYYFKTDIRSDELTHVAFTMDGSIINLYVDGVLKETVDMGTPISYCHTEMFIGGDGRATGDQIFKGKIYAVNIFEDIRTDEEIKQDVLWVASNADGLLYQKSFGN